MNITPDNEKLFLALWGATRRAVMNGTAAEITGIIEAKEAEFGHDHREIKADVRAIFAASAAITEHEHAKIESAKRQEGPDAVS